MGLDLSGVTLPFSVGDLVTATMDLLGVIGPFVLLAIAFILVPKFIGIVRAALAARRNAA